MSQTAQPIGRRCPSCSGIGKLPNGKLTGFVVCEVCEGTGLKRKEG